MRKKIIIPKEYQDQPLDSYYSNPEFHSAADKLINTIQDYIVRVKAQPYDGEEVLKIANKILEGRIR